MNHRHLLNAGIAAGVAVICGVLLLLVGIQVQAAIAAGEGQALAAGLLAATLAVIVELVRWITSPFRGREKDELN